MADENNNQNPPDNSPPEETVSPEPPAKKGGLGIGTIALGSLAGVAGGASRRSGDHRICRGRGGGPAFALQSERAT
ncbi:MAG: hypothetical protein HYV40_01385 [Candidatus Levybacteria bacterium]|nr:hypothetical protein [Candidatus Levybacteria bacterium]